MGSVTEVAIAVVEAEGRFLVGERPADSPLGGHWEFPGGKIEPGETAAEAAERECFEETGVRVLVRDLLIRHTHRYAHGTIQLEFLACTLAESTTEPRDPFRWVDRCDLADLNFPAGNKQLLKLLQA